MKAKKNGFTIVEVVIALAVIAIVTLTATTIILSASKIQRNAHEEFFAVNLCENSLEIFRAASHEKTDDQDIYDSCISEMDVILGIKPEQPTGAAGEYTAKLNWNFKQCGEGEEEKYICSLKFSKADGGLELTVKVSSAGGATLHEASFLSYKGGA